MTQRLFLDAVFWRHKRSYVPDSRHCKIFKLHLFWKSSGFLEIWCAKEGSDSIDKQFTDRKLKLLLSWVKCHLIANFCGSRLYMSGVNFDPLAIYPPVRLPVSSTTPMLSSLVRWDHSDSWEVPSIEDFLARCSRGSGSGCTSTVEVDISSPDSEDAYLTGHRGNGRVLYPATGYLVLAWRQLARMNGQTYQQTPVSFSDVHIHRATILPSTGESRLMFMYHFWNPVHIRRISKAHFPLHRLVADLVTNPGSRPGPRQVCVMEIGLNSATYLLCYLILCRHWFGLCWSACFSRNALILANDC